MNINIFGSTGVIGRKSLSLINHNFPNLKINLLCAKSNYKLLKKQIIKYKPKYVFLYDQEKFTNIDTNIGKTKFLNMYNKDLLGRGIPNTEFWLSEVFSYLTAQKLK